MADSSKAPKASEIYDLVSQITEAKGTRISPAEVRRVIAAYHTYLASIDSNRAFSIISRGISTARKSSLFQYLKRKVPGNKKNFSF